MKPRIAFLFSGQTRENTLCDTIITSYNNENDEYDNIINTHFKNTLYRSCEKSDDITDSYNKFIFTDEFKEKYDYDIFIATDTIDIDKTVAFFGEKHVKNIFVSSNKYYLNKFDESQMHDAMHFVNKYCNNDFTLVCDEPIHKDENGYWRYPIGIIQYHRLYHCYNMMCQYSSNSNVKYDFIVRSRLDVTYTSNFLNLFDLFNDSNLQICAVDDIVAVGKPEIMHTYCNIVDTIGTFENLDKRDNFKVSIIDIEKWIKFLTEDEFKYNLKYSTLQLCEALFLYCDENGLDIDKTIRHTGNMGYFQRFSEVLTK